MNKLSMIFFSVLLIVGVTSAQVVPEPEFSKRPYFLDSVSNSLKSFERVNGEIETKVKGMGFGPAEGFLACSGTSSTIRFKASAPDAVIQLEDNQDPADMLFLSKASINVKKQNRQFLLVQKAGLGDAKASKERIELEFKKVSKNTYRILFPELAPGEYALIGGGDVAGGVLKVPCFGID